MRDTTRLAIARALCPVVRQLVLDCPAMRSDDESRAASARVVRDLERHAPPALADIERLLPLGANTIKNACLRSAALYLGRALRDDGASERSLFEVLQLIDMYEQED